jgi:hypothetical protein
MSQQFNSSRVDLYDLAPTLTGVSPGGDDSTYVALIGRMYRDKIVQAVGTTVF